MMNTLVVLRTLQSEKVVLVNVQSVSFQIPRDLDQLPCSQLYIPSIPQTTRQRREDISH